MEENQNHKELIVQDVPELPAISDEKTELTGFRRVVHNFRLGGIESDETARKKRILAEARIQLLRDRTSEVINAWRIQAGVARKAIIKAAEEYVQSCIENAEVRMGAGKNVAIREAVTNYYDLVSTIRSDLPEDLKSKIIEEAGKVLDQTIGRITLADFDAESAISSTYTEKKGLLDRFRK